MRAAYNDLLAAMGSANKKLQLSDVRVAELRAQSSEIPVHGTIEVNVELFNASRICGAVVEVASRYRVTATQGARIASSSQENDGNALDPVLAWEVGTSFIATFERLSQDEELSELERRAFAITTALMAIHPYARELVQNTVGRLGYPPFTLQLLHSPLITLKNDEGIVDLDDDEWPIPSM
jgi:hypothetical protein